VSTIRHNLQFLLGLKLIGLAEPLGRGDALIEALRVTNDIALRQKLLTPALMEAVGGLEAQALLTDDALLYAQWSAELPAGPEVPLQLLSQLLHWAGTFVNALWLVKDNAVTFELGFLEVSAPGRLPAWHSNFLAQSVQKADGTKPRVVFTRAELRKAREIFRDILLPMAHAGDEEVHGPLKFSDALVTANPAVPRLKRAMYFLSSARMNRDLGMKTAMYCSLLESLFSTDSNEITHKISHRIAMFLSGDVPARCSMYNQIKKAYNIRSKVVHGDSISTEAAKSIGDISTGLDEICRTVLTRICCDPALTTQFSATKKDLDDYFLKTSFGANGTPPQAKTTSATPNN